MLPRIAKLDLQFADALQSYVQQRSRRSPVLNQIKSHLIHEGGGTSIRRSPTDEETTDLREASAETKMSFEEIEAIDLNYVLGKANEIADQFERQFSTHLFETIDEVTKKTGLRGDAGGTPLTNDKLIELLSKMEMNFENSEDGDLTIVTSPQMTSTFERLDREMRENPEIRKKWQSMKEAKRREFREREINRNLAG